MLSQNSLVVRRVCVFELFACERHTSIGGALLQLCDLWPRPAQTSKRRRISGTATLLSNCTTKCFSWRTSCKIALCALRDAKGEDRKAILQSNVQSNWIDLHRRSCADNEIMRILLSIVCVANSGGDRRVTSRFFDRSSPGTRFKHRTANPSEFPLSRCKKD